METDPFSSNPPLGIYIHARAALRAGFRGFVWMTRASITHTKGVAVRPTEVDGWFWFTEIERFTQPSFITFCPSCDSSMACEEFERRFRESPAFVVTSTVDPSTLVSVLIASKAALARERGIYGGDTEVLAAMIDTRSTIAKRTSELFGDVKKAAVGMFARRTGVPTHVANRVSDAFFDGMKSGVSGTRVDPFASKPPSPERETQTADVYVLARKACEACKRMFLAWPPPREAVVQDRFRSLAMMVHPDHGGDADSMRALIEDRDAILTYIRLQGGASGI